MPMRRHNLRAVALAVGITLIAPFAPGTAEQTSPPFTQEAYLKASNTQAGDQFGFAVAVSADTAVVGAQFESSSANTIDGDQSNNSAPQAGAAYVFVRTGTGWSQQAYLKASNAGVADHFGHAVAISGDTIVIGAPDASVPGALVATGAAYVFVRTGSTWRQQAVLTPSNPGLGDQFGKSVAVSGETIVVGAHWEDSGAAGVDGDQSSNVASAAGAAYVFVRNGTTWSQQAYLKASNPGVDDMFGFTVTVSGDTAVVGAWQEDSAATGVDGDQASNAASLAGAAYVFARQGTTWSQQAYLKASNTFQGQHFGYSVALSGETLVVGARLETSLGIGVNGDQTPNRASAVGAAYVFERSGGTWNQHTYLKASNSAQFDQFGYSVAISGNAIVVGAIEEDSAAAGVDGNQGDNSVTGAGAAYVFVRNGGVWSQHSYLKASSPGVEDSFGNAVAVSGGTALIGAFFEASNATGVNGDEANNSAFQSGAVYLFELPNTAPTITASAISRWPDTSGNFTIATVNDAEDGPGSLAVTVASANPANGITLSGVTNVGGIVTADVMIDPGASSASFLICVSDAWGGSAENAFEVTVVPPVVVTPSILPAANASGWHKGAATVDWVVTGSASQSACGATVLSAETTTNGITVTCTAANAGGSTSETVTIRIDLTPPTGTASRLPLPNANGWTNVDVGVSFTCADALSGTITPAWSNTISGEGAGQSRSFACLDRAGNTLPLLVTGVNIDKTAPLVVPDSLTTTPNPAMVNAAVSMTVSLTDTGSSNLARAEYRINTGPYGLLAPASTASGTVTGSIGAFVAPGVVEACARGVDLAGNYGTDECTLIAVFDPTAGYVTGAGTIDSPAGALTGSTAAGTARFGFQSKYARGATVPTGKTQFKFKAGDLDFASTLYDWLVVAGARAQFKGTGLIKDRPGIFTFLLTAIDGDQPGGGGVDKFRLKITGAGGVIYDNQPGGRDGDDPSTAIESGHIEIRK